MENYFELLLGSFFTLIPISLIIVKKYADEYIINLIKDIFKSKTDEKAKSILKSFIVILLIIGISLMSFAFMNEEQEMEQVIPAQKSETELYIDAAETAIDIIGDEINKKKKRDSVIISNRKQRFVYQIGSKIDNKDAVLELYLQLKEHPQIDISKVYVFKESRKAYYLIKNDDYSEAQINDYLNSFKSKLYNIETNIEIIDVVRKFCKAKESIVKTKPLKFRKEDVLIPCYKTD